MWVRGYNCLFVQVFKLIESIYWDGRTDTDERTVMAFTSVPLNSRYRSDIIWICMYSLLTMIKALNNGMSSHTSHCSPQASQWRALLLAG